MTHLKSFQKYSVGKCIPNVSKAARQIGIQKISFLLLQSFDGLSNHLHSRY